MSAWQQWLQHPEKVWVRKCFFYIHLWVGVGVGLYIVLMSVTGSTIVFRNELETFPSMISAVEWIVNLHENLLLGNMGRFVNGIGAICVTVLSFTGAIIWWPGINNWRRALTVNRRSFFARFTWDLHSAMGFWGFLFLLMWGISAFYFSFPKIVNALAGFADPSDRYADRFLDWLSMAHFGRFGWFTEVIWTLLGLMPAVLALTGVFLCCRRIVYKSPPARP